MHTYGEYWKVVNPEVNKSSKSMKNCFTKLSNDWILWTNNTFWKDNCLAVVVRGYNKDINFAVLSQMGSRCSLSIYFPGRFPWMVWIRNFNICLKIELQYFLVHFWFFPSMTILMIKVFADSVNFSRKFLQFVTSSSGWLKLYWGKIILF